MDIKKIAEKYSTQFDEYKRLLKHPDPNSVNHIVWQDGFIKGYISREKDLKQRDDTIKKQKRELIKINTLKDRIKFLEGKKQPQFAKLKKYISELESKLRGGAFNTKNCTLN